MLEKYEAAISSKGPIAPRVTLEQIRSLIIDETYTVLPSGKKMVCEITLKNGFTVTGEAGVVSKENFDEEVGKMLSRNRAVEKIWLLEGYLLQEGVYQGVIKSDNYDEGRTD